NNAESEPHRRDILPLGPEGGDKGEPAGAPVRAERRRPLYAEADMRGVAHSEDDDKHAHKGMCPRRPDSPAARASQQGEADMPDGGGAAAQRRGAADAEAGGGAGL